MKPTDPPQTVTAISTTAAAAPYVRPITWLTLAIAALLAWLFLIIGVAMNGPWLALIAPAFISAGVAQRTWSELRQRG